jgi:hypothetical protein
MGAVKDMMLERWDWEERATGGHQWDIFDESQQVYRTRVRMECRACGCIAIINRDDLTPAQADLIRAHPEGMDLLDLYPEKSGPVLAFRFGFVPVPGTDDDCTIGQSYRDALDDDD